MGSLLAMAAVAKRGNFLLKSDSMERRGQKAPAVAGAWASPAPRPPQGSLVFMLRIMFACHVPALNAEH